MTCGSVWTCPVCSLKIAAKRAEELAAAIDTWKDRDGYLCMVTATIQHRHGDRYLADRRHSTAIALIWGLKSIANYVGFGLGLIGVFSKVSFLIERLY